MVRKQLFRFIIIGSFGTLVDYIVYTLLLSSFSVIFAKGLSFIGGSIIAFVLNKTWTFENRDRAHPQAFKFAILYILTLGANISVNYGILLILSKQYLVAFVIATGVHTVLNFFGQKFWVFKEIN